jgi:hypothetical protein
LTRLFNSTLTLLAPYRILNWVITTCFIALSIPVQLCAQKKIHCPDGDHFEIPVNQIAIQYNGSSFAATLGGLGTLESHVSLDHVKLQEATAATQQWNQFVVALAAGYNSCAVTKQEYEEGIQKIYPRLQEASSDLDKIKKQILESTNANTKALTKALERALERYNTNFRQFAEVGGQEKLLESIKQNTDQILRDVEEIKKNVPKNQGLLRPASDPDPPTPHSPLRSCDDIPKDALKIFLGNSMGWTQDSRQSVLKIDGREALTVTFQNEKIGVYAKFFSKDARIVAELDGDKYYVNPGNSFRVENPDDSTLTVYDGVEGAKILHVRFLNKNSLLITGTFRSHLPARRPVVVKDNYIDAGFKMGNMCIVPGGSTIFDVRTGPSTDSDPEPEVSGPPDFVQDPLKGLSDLQVAEKALTLASTIESLGRQCIDNMQNIAKTQDEQDAFRSKFRAQMESCCLVDLKKLHYSLLLRKPSLKTQLDEMPYELFFRQTGCNHREITSYLREAALSLKHQARAVTPPRALVFTETHVAPEDKRATEEIRVSFTMPDVAKLGYVVISFEGSYFQVWCESPCESRVPQESDVADNRALAEGIYWGGDTPPPFVLRVGDGAVQNVTSFHVRAMTGKRVRVSKVVFFEE